MRPALFWTGLAVATVTTVAAEFLPSAPSAIQTSALQPVGSFLVNNQTIITLVALLLILVSIFV